VGNKKDLGSIHEDTKPGQGAGTTRMVDLQTDALCVWSTDYDLIDLYNIYFTFLVCCLYWTQLIERRPHINCGYIHCSLTNNCVQICYYAPKMVESWKGQKLLSRAEFHVGAHISKFLRLQMLPTQGLVSEKTNRFALVFATLDGGIGCIAPVDELTFRRLQSLQRKLVDAVPHMCGLNPRSFRQFKSNGKGHRPGPDNIIDFELLLQ
jgi:hypothetical protein